MIGQYDPRRQAPPSHVVQHAGDGSGHGRDGSGLRRFLGGSPLAVLMRLVVLSVLVGAGMAMLGLTPGLLFWHLYDAVRWTIDVGLVTFHDFGRWILAGAVVVVPLWLISRFLSLGR